MVTAEQEAGVILQAREELARRSFSDFCRRMSGDAYEQPPHVLMLCQYLEAVERREITRLIVEMPPRSSKSTHVSRLFPAWWIGRNPSSQIIVASYADLLATDHGRYVRDLMMRDVYPFATELRHDSRAAGRWETTDGGRLLAVGVGSGLTGHGGHLGVIDDPVKDRQEADSELVRANTWSWYQDVFRTRIMRDGVIVLLGTRWHEDDLIGRVLNSAGAADWTRLSLPYLAEEHDLLGRAPGQPLDVFGDVPSVEKGEISSRGFAALYQQRPAPAEGGTFKRAWLQRRYATLPGSTLRPLPDRSQNWRVEQYIDTNLKEGVASDYSVIATWGTDGISYYLLDVWRRQCDYPTLRQAVEEQYWQHRPRTVVVENRSNGLPLVQDLRQRTPIPVVAIDPKGSKEIRADAVTPLFESGHVVLPEAAPWLEPWMAEHLAFPAGAHDDQVDTTSMALYRLANFTAKQAGGQLFKSVSFV